MERLSMCRVCLGEDARLHSIVGTHLQEMYESLVLIPLETSDSRPVLACYICCARLKNCYELRKSCLQSEELFTQMLSSNEPEQVKLQGINSAKRLTMNNVIHLSLGHALEMNADNVGVEAVKSEVKLEPTVGEDIDEDALEENSVFDNVQSADSGDDFVIIVKEEQTGDMTIDPTPKASTQDDQRYPVDLTSSNLKYHVLIQATVQDLSPENSTHTAQKPHQCDICHRSFSGIQYLASHMLIHTSEKPYQCDVCSKRFSLKELLIKHMRIHTNEKPFQCNICDKKFSCEGYMTIHMRAHTGEKPYHCHLCDKRFSSKNNLRQHLPTHTGEKPHYCDICRKKFSQRGNLIRHMRTHSGEKLFSCDMCEKQFTTKTSLEYHKHTHTGERPYQCHICKKQFAQKCALDRHIRTHTGDKSYQCHTCNKQFSQRRYLNSHMLSNKCGKPNESDMLRNTQFKKSSYSQIGGKTLHCEICKKKYTVRQHLIKHMRKHTDEKPHQCNICKRSFSHLCYLRRHMATHTDKIHVLETGRDLRQEPDV